LEAIVSEYQDSMGTRQGKRSAFPVREREILRVAGELGGTDGHAAVESTRAMILQWATEQIGGQLPDTAAEGLPFELFMGGRTCVGASINDDRRTLWASRIDRPDSNVAQRMWTTEVVVGRAGAGSAMFSLRLLASSPEHSLKIDPAVPSLVQTIAERCGLGHGGIRYQATSYSVNDTVDGEQLIEALLSPTRSIPFVVFSKGARDSIRTYQANLLARSLMGIARVILLPQALAATLSQQFGKNLAVLNGSARIYMPGFSGDANPYLHRQFLPTTSDSGSDWDRSISAIRWLVASESIKRRRLGEEVVAFADVREAGHDFERERLRSTGSGAQLQLNAAQEQITSLKEDLRRANSETDQWMAEYERVDFESKNFERQFRGANLRVQQLLSQIQARGESPDSNVQLPGSWDDFADWCDETLAGRVVLCGRARRELKAPAYESPETAARCLLWLANEYRDSRMIGGSGDLRKPIEEGIHNDRCGSDSFEFTWSNDQKVLVEWHIKNGGNTREPRRCLRIYYFWDELQQLVVVVSLPAHLRTGAT